MASPAPQHPRKKLRAILLIGLLAGVAGVLLSHWAPAETLEKTGLDLLFILRGARQPRPDVVVVGIDEDSYDVMGCPPGDAAGSPSTPCAKPNQPWPRTLHAELIRTLKKEGARALVFDVLFTEPTEPMDPEGDRALAQALAEAGNVVIGSNIDVTADPRFRLSRSQDPLPEFVANAAAVGDVGFPPERTGLMRTTWLVRGDRPTLALAAYEVATGDHSKRAGGQAPRTIDYYGPSRTVPNVSYYQAFEPAEYLPPGFFKDKIVFVGLCQAVSVGPDAKDAFPTPFSSASNPRTYGVEIHATIAANLLEGRRIDLLPPLPEALLLMLIPVLVTALFVTVRPLLGAFAFFGMELAVWGMGCVAFARASLWLPLMIPALVQLPAVYVLALIWYYLTTVRERERIRRAFTFYLSPDMIHKIVADPSSLNLGGEEIVATALFTDIKGFTAIAESLPAPDTAAMLNAYFSRLTRCVFADGGTLIKFIGDAVFAIWGAPLRMEDHATRACAAALAMARGQDVKPEDDPHGVSRLVTRIGIHTGPMLVGNLGSEERFDYTAIGDAVNTASRLESLNRHFGTKTLVSQATLAMTGREFIARPLGKVRMVGKQEPVEIFELLGRRGEETSVDVRGLVRFMEALADFQARRFEQAAAGFKEVEALGGEAGDPPSRLYHRESLRLAEEPPPEGWSGVITFETK